MMCVLYVLWYAKTFCPKGTCWAEATSNSEKIKPITQPLLRFSEDIASQLSHMSSCPNLLELHTK